MKPTVKIIVLSFFVLLLITCKGQENKKPYSEFIAEIISVRDSFGIEYANAEVKDSIVKLAREYLISTMADELLPNWYGTPWDFNGTTRTPQKGKIACGYFVTNTLSDLGFQIPRVKWAQSASEVFISKLSYGHIKRFSNQSISTVEKYLKESGNGMYLAGLDMHTGFLYVYEGSVRFIHADYYEPENGVVSEKIDAHGPFADSSYRVIGKLFSDEMMIKWLKNLEIN